MSILMFIIIIISLCSLFIISLLRFLKEKSAKEFIISTLLLIVCFVLILLFYLNRSGVSSKGDGGNVIYFIIILFICMFLGMLAHYLYDYFITPKSRRKKKKFDFGRFIAPVFASPIIFIPLLASFQDAAIDLQNLTITRIMIFLVAFENGFFWKEFFSHRQKEIEQGE